MEDGVVPGWVIDRLDAVADEVARVLAPDRLPWWGPSADAWRDDMRRDVAALRAATQALRWSGTPTVG